MKLTAVMKKLVVGAGLAGMLAMPAAVLAHSSLTASLPGNQAVVSSPEKLELTFNEDVRMLRLTLVHGPSHNIEFGFQPSTAAAKTFSYPLPALMNGEHTVSWTVIGSDGHTVSGTYNFSVSPDGAAAQAEAHGHEHGHGHDAGHSHGGGEHHHH